MKILSFDVGIKNLALCLLETKNDNKDKDNNNANEKNNKKNKYDVKILDWQLIDLSPCVSHKCSYEKKGKAKEGTANICNLNASYKDPHGNLYCKRHAKSSEFLIPDTKLNLNQLSRNSVKKLNEIIELYKIDLKNENFNEKLDKSDKPNKPNKNFLISIIENYKNKHFLTTIEKEGSKASKDSLIGLCRIMTQKLDALYDNKLYHDIDAVYIENQIGKIAVRMKSIQGMLTQYFVGRGIPIIEYISSINKLKNFCEKKNMNYKERKAESIIVTRNQLELYNPNWLEFFNTFSKKDDLADSYLQALSQLDE